MTHSDIGNESKAILGDYEGGIINLEKKLFNLIFIQNQVDFCSKTS